MDFYKIEAANRNRKLIKKLNKDNENRKLTILKISNQLRTSKATYVSKRYLSLGEELSRENIRCSLVEFCLPHGDDWSKEWDYDRSGVKRILHLQKMNTDRLKENFCIHKVSKIINNIVVTTNKNNNRSNANETHLVLKEFAQSAFLIGFWYEQPGGNAYFEDLGDPFDSFEDLLDEEIRRPVFFHQDEKIGNTSVAKVIKEL